MLQGQTIGYEITVSYRKISYLMISGATLFQVRFETKRVFKIFMVPNSRTPE